MVIGKLLPSEIAAPSCEFGTDHFPELDLYRKLGLDEMFLLELQLRAAHSGASLEDELLADGRMDEVLYFEALAAVSGIPFVDDIPAAWVHFEPAIDTQLKRPKIVRCHPPDQMPFLVHVPTATTFLPKPAVGQRATSRSHMRRMVWQRGSEARLRRSAELLFDNKPEFSARLVLRGHQGFLFGAIASFVVIFGCLFPIETFLGLHVLLSLFYLLSLVLKAMALRISTFRVPAKCIEEVEGPFPLYSVLVALYHEDAVVGQLVENLGELAWPPSRLDIKLICEEDDLSTRAALEAMELPSQFEIVIVPDGKPKTKPKALNYGFEGARGEFVAVYDAEDRPHPQQLLEAWSIFRTASARTACLQAPLVVTNARRGWLPSLFALEYAAQFRRWLPFLAGWQAPLPLGGTSNHFRAECLRAIGGWDPYNVTEDADLGVRLARGGYSTRTLVLPTLEDAPTEMNIWIRQRTRWLKGWMQTWLVHMRHPLRLLKELGWRGFFGFHASTTGMLLSAIWHPMLYVFLVLFMTGSFDRHGGNMLARSIMWIDLFNAVNAYVLFLALGRVAMRDLEKTRLRRCFWALPFYWLMLTWAAFRAIWQLNRDPFKWEKTPHQPSSNETHAS